MKRTTIVLTVLMIAGSVWASVGVPWQTGAAGTTHQEWLFDSGANPAAPEVDGNPYGDPVALVNGSPFGSDIAWGNGIWTGTQMKVVIDIPNNPVPNAYKDLYIELAYQGDLALSWVVDQMGNDFSLVSRDITTQGNWTILKDYWRIEPNPNSETLCFGFTAPIGALAAVDYVIVDTICIPEPATMALLSIGALVFLKRRNR